MTVTGDVLIDLDQNHEPVWLWPEFDHLDTNRYPMNFPDWTHTNAIVYSPDDGDLIVFIRHLYWVIKVDYNNGNGTGNILWKLGWQGDFTLMNGTGPVDWFYAQHDSNVISSNSSGTFQMTMFDNGDNRVLDLSGDICGASGQPACYSRVPIIQIDEAAKTAMLQWVNNLSPIYSFWGGSSRLLANDDMEFDECALAWIQVSTRSPKPHHQFRFGKCKSAVRMHIGRFACSAFIRACSGETARQPTRPLSGRAGSALDAVASRVINRR
ncbi:MAG: aryl-sulfate sulfotransferase [Candidatus Acidiferrales bacterium]